MSFLRFNHLAVIRDLLSNLAVSPVLLKRGSRCFTAAVRRLLVAPSGCAEHCATAVSNTSLGMQGQLGSEISRWESIRASRNMSSIFEAGAGKKAAGQSGKCL